MQDLKTKGSKAIPDELTYLIVNSKIKSAIMPVKEYEMLINALEELEDINDIEQRKNEPLVDHDEVFSS